MNRYSSWAVFSFFFVVLITGLGSADPGYSQEEQSLRLVIAEKESPGWFSSFLGSSREPVESRDGYDESWETFRSRLEKRSPVSVILDTTVTIQPDDTFSYKDIVKTKSVPGTFTVGHVLSGYVRNNTLSIRYRWDELETTERKTQNGSTVQVPTVNHHTIDSLQSVSTRDDGGDYIEQTGNHVFWFDVTQSSRSEE